jgi:hypothetical protein
VSARDTAESQQDPKTASSCSWEPSDEPCRVVVGHKECGEGWASHANGTIYVHDFAADGVNRPHPNLRLIEIGGLADDFATGF